MTPAERLVVVENDVAGIRRAVDRIEKSVDDLKDTVQTQLVELTLQKAKAEWERGLLRWVLSGGGLVGIVYTIGRIVGAWG